MFLFRSDVDRNSGMQFGEKQTPRFVGQKRRLPARVSEPGVCHLGVVPPALAAGMGHPKELCLEVHSLSRITLALPWPYAGVDTAERSKQK